MTEYIVYTENGIVKIKNNTVGEIVSSGPDARICIQKMFNILSGDEHIIFEGDFFLSNEIRLHKNNVYIEQNNGKFYGNYGGHHGLVIIDCDNISIKGVHIENLGMIEKDNGKYTKLYFPFFIKNSKHVSVENVFVINCGASGIHSENVDDLKLYNCYSENDWNVTYNDGDGFDIFYSRDVRIVNCRVIGSDSGFGIYASDDVVVEKCTAKSTYRYSFKVSDWLYPPINEKKGCSNVSFIDCIEEDCKLNDGFACWQTNTHPEYSGKRHNNIHFIRCTARNNPANGFAMRHTDEGSIISCRSIEHGQKDFFVANSTGIRIIK